MRALFTLAIHENLMFFRHVSVVELPIERVVPAASALEGFGGLVHPDDVRSQNALLQRKKN